MVTCTMLVEAAHVGKGGDMWESSVPAHFSCESKITLLFLKNRILECKSRLVYITP